MEEENEQRILSLNKNNFNTGLTTLQLQGIFYFILAEQKNISPFIVFNLEKKLTLYCSYSWVSEWEYICSTSCNKEQEAS